MGKARLINFLISFSFNLINMIFLGTCALSLPQIKNESDYFNFTLGLRDHFDFGPILKAGGIVPDDTLLYDLDKIILFVPESSFMHVTVSC